MYDPHVQFTDVPMMEEGGSDCDSNSGSKTPTQADPRLTKAVGLVRGMTSPQLKEQCVTTEWGRLDTDVEKDILIEALQDPAFWREVKEMTAADMESLPEEEESEENTHGRLLQMFKCFDKEGVGRIDRIDLQQMLLYMGISTTESEVLNIIEKVTGDRSRNIGEEAFLQVMEAAQSGALSIATVSKESIKRASFRIRSETD